MRFKDIPRKIPGTYTRDGITVPVTKTEMTREPAFPIDFQMLALRGAVGIVLTLTLVAVAWSTYSIGSLLHGGVGYIAAVIFDLGWAVSILLEYLARYDRRKRDFPKKLGWALLVVTMAAIALDGLQRGSIPMAVIGAFVSLFAKCLWMGVMKHINAELSADDEAWVTAQMSGAQAEAAVAQIRRTTARISQRATLELLAMEREKQQVSEAFGLTAQTSTELAEDCAAPAELEVVPPTIADISKTDAVRLVLRQHPEASADSILSALQEHRDDIELKYVRDTMRRLEQETDNVIEFHK